MHPSLVQLLIADKPDRYLFPEPNNVESLPEVHELFLPVEIDTEFYHVPISFDGARFRQQTLTVQCRHIYKPVGEIFSVSFDRSVKPHQKIQTDFTVIDYLNSIGFEASILVHDCPIQLEKTLHFYLYSFFQVAELFRIFDGKCLKDIRELCVREGHSVIEQGRRLQARTDGTPVRTYVDLPKWEVVLNGVSYGVRLTLIDTCAVQGNTSYGVFCANSGVQLSFKDMFTREEKAQMHRQYQDRPEDFDNYALGDLYNYEALKGNADSFQSIYDSLGIGVFFEVPRLTIGATVAHMTESCLQDYLGISDKKLVRKFTRTGTAALLKDYRSTTALYLAKVDGGRCRNNRPNDVSVHKPICDIDISGCYGEGLRNQIYPVGVPVLIDYKLGSSFNKFMTLREFLKDYSDELVPGLWKARVSTLADNNLDYAQDFLISWYPPKDLGKKMREGVDLESVEWFDEDNLGVSKIFTHEINLAVITHDFVQWIDNVCSAKQRNDLLDKLVVNCAMFYPLSKQVKDFETLANNHRNHTGRNTTSYKKGMKIVIEMDCHSWVGVNMGDLLVTKLLLERKKHPKKSALNELYKLCINTVYGDMVSPFFPIGNVCVGDNITARARAMAWYMEKGLNGFQTITDGCSFELNRVIFPSDRTLTASSLINKNDNGVHYKYNGLGLKTWEIIDWVYVVVDDNTIYKPVIKVDGEIVDDALGLVDKLAGEHLRKLFSNVDVLHATTSDVNGKERIGQFAFESKGIFSGGSFHGSANYAFFDNKGEVVGGIKMRSYRKLGNKSIGENDERLEIISEDSSPAKDFLVALYNHPEKIERSIPFLSTRILKLGSYRRMYTSLFEYSPVFPGCTFENMRLLRECTLAQYTFQTKGQWDNWEREAEKLRGSLAQTYETFYLSSGSVDFKAMARELSELIGKGENGYLKTPSTHRKTIQTNFVGHPQQALLETGKDLLKRWYGFDWLIKDDGELVFE